VFAITVKRCNREVVLTEKNYNQNGKQCKKYENMWFVLMYCTIVRYNRDRYNRVRLF